MMDLWYYPKWWLEKLQQNQIPWDHYQSVDLPVFLKRYKLHDTYLAGIDADTEGDGRVTFAIKPHWFWSREPGIMLEPEIMLLCFTRVYQMNWSGPKLACSSVIIEAGSRRVQDVEKERFLDLAVAQTGMNDEEKEFILDSALYHTFFLIEYRDRISLYHDRSVAVLVMGKNAQAISLPLDSVEQ